MIKWGELTTISIAIIGFGIGYLISLVTQWKYLRYGFSKYEEVLIPEEWYEKLVIFVSEDRELYITIGVRLK